MIFGNRLLKSFFFGLKDRDKTKVLALRNLLNVLSESLGFKSLALIRFPTLT